MGRACEKDRFRFALWLLLIMLCACSEPVARQKGLTDADLFARGMQRLERKKFGDAIEHFQVFLERFPASPLAPRAQLALADARRERKEFAEAETGYDDFLRLYPAHDNVPYALYRKGELLVGESAAPGRDQSKTIEAVKAFTALREKAPAGPYAEVAAAKVRELRNRLGEHEALVAAHYLSARKLDSAEARARRAIEEYGDTAALPRLMALLADALAREGKAAESAEVRKSLREKFPESGEKTK